jgi:hypothetical protein
MSIIGRNTNRGQIRPNSRRGVRRINYICPVCEGRGYTMYPSTYRSDGIRCSRCWVDREEEVWFVPRMNSETLTQPDNRRIGVRVDQPRA